MFQSFLLSEAKWTFGENPEQPLQWAASQTVNLVEQLTSVKPKISTVIDGTGGIIVGSPGNNSLIRQAELPELGDDGSLGLDDYVIRSAVADGKSVIYIAGKNDRAAMFGLFAFFEVLGCKFLLSRDVLPATNPELKIPAMDIIGRTECQWRGVWIGSCFATISLMSLEDYQRMFDQLAKMRMNRVVYYPFENEPFIDYSYAGERKLIGDTTHPESGYTSLGRQDVGSYRVQDMVVGKELFDREFIAPLEFQHVRSSAEALDTGKEFMSQLISMAAERGLGTWISYDPAFVSLNMAKYIRPMPRSKECYSALVSFTDPVVHEINRNRIANIIDSYPQLEGIFFQVTEGFYEDRYPESQAIIAREWDKYGEARNLLREHWGKWWVGEEKQDICIRADIGFVELMKQSAAVARELKPSLGLGVLTVCKAYLLTYLHEILPKDMPFIDIESQSLWTVDGAPLHLFQRMQGRQCALVPRAYDDGSLAGLQCNLSLYQRDGFLASRQENGTNGLVVQISHINGNDHNVRFLAEGMWNETLTPEDFYRDYAISMFGEQSAGPITEAFKILEDNEQFLGGRGLKNMPYTFTPPEVVLLRQFKNHTKPFMEPALTDDIVSSHLDSRVEAFTQSRLELFKALERFDHAAKTCTSSGKDELDYLRNKTRAYAQHLETLILFRDVYAEYVASFAVIKQGVPAFRDRFRLVIEAAGRIEQSAIAAAEGFTVCAVHPTDCGVVWMMNKTIHASRVLRQYLNNIMAYFEGREYWNPVEWEMLNGSSPYPTYHIEEIDTLVLG